LAPEVSRTALADRILEVVPRSMRHIRAEMRTESIAAGGRPLTVPQLRALTWIRRKPGQGLSPLADHLGMSLPACSALVDRLVRAGLVERATDPTERRRIQLRLTPDGLEQVGRARLRVRTWLTGELAGREPSELAGLMGALDVLEAVTSRHGRRAGRRPDR
jgi:DNA-binding MarR family transcriptional regulator